jgi:hypothetical protein
MFRAVFLPIIRSFSIVQWHWYSLCSSVTECINCTSAVVRLRSSWWRAERLPKTCRVIITNKNWNSVHLLVLFTRNLSRCMVIQSYKKKFWDLKYLKKKYFYSVIYKHFIKPDDGFLLIGGIRIQILVECNNFKSKHLNNLSCNVTHYNSTFLLLTWTLNF